MSNVVVVDIRNMGPGNYEIVNGKLVQIPDPPVMPELETARAKYDKLFIALGDENVVDDKEIYRRLMKLDQDIEELEEYQEALNEVINDEQE